MAETRKRTPEEEEQWLDDQLAEAYALMGNNPAVKAEAPAPAAQKAASEQTPGKKKEKGVTGLVILMCLELLGLAGVAGYWLVHLL